MARAEKQDDSRAAGGEDSAVSRVFIPCPACQSPIELPVGNLPKRIACPSCGTVLER